MSGFLLLYPSAVKAVWKARTPLKLRCHPDVLYLLWPSVGAEVKPIRDDLLERLSWLLGTEVRMWEWTLDAGEVAGCYREMCDDSATIDRAVEANGLRIDGFDWSRAKANDRVLVRMAWPYYVRHSLWKAVRSMTPEVLIVPWRARRFGVIERSGFFGFYAVAQSLFHILNSFEETFGIRIESMWPARASHESVQKALASVAMTTTRCAVLFGRSLRDAWRFRERDLPRPQNAAVGFIVTGMSCWESVRPLLAQNASYEPVVLQDDIFRSPTAYRALVNDRVPFVPMHSLISPLEMLSCLVSFFVRRFRLKRSLRRKLVLSMDSSDLKRTELTEYALRDADSLVELLVFRKELGRAIQKYRFRAIVTANILDSFLSVGTATAHEHALPSLCVQNAAHPLYPIPVPADCDIYFAASRRLAQCIADGGSPARVVTVGLPSFDEIVGRRETGQTGGGIRERFPSLQDRLIVTIVSQAGVFDPVPLAEKLIDVATDEIGIIIKVHPREAPERFRRIASQLDARGLGTVLHRENFVDVISETDVLMSSYSAGMMWSLAMGIPTVSILPGYLRHIPDSVDYMSPSLVKYFSDIDEAAVWVSGLRRDCPELRQHRAMLDERVPELLAGMDGHASSRIVREIVNVIRTVAPVEPAGAPA